MGDHDAFARIMATHDGDMTRICMVMCGDLQVARDAVQAAWPIAWRRLASLRDPARLRPWLTSIAANEARQIVRTEGRRLRRELQEAPRLPPDPAERVERLDLIAAVRRLSPDERRLESGVPCIDHPWQWRAARAAVRDATIAGSDPVLLAARRTRQYRYGIAPGGPGGVHPGSGVVGHVRSAPLSRVPNPAHRVTVPRGPHRRR